MATTKLEVQTMGLSLQALYFVVISVHCSFEFCKLGRNFRLSMQRSNKFRLQRLGYFQVRLFNKVE